MPLSDFFQTISSKVLPEKRGSLPLQPSTTGVGIGSGGHVPFEDDMIVSKPAIVFHTLQVFFNFLAMCCFASVAAFQAKWGVGPSGLSGFAIFISVAGIFYSLFLLFVPVVYEKYDKGARLARALKEVRVEFILTGTGTAISLLIAFITIISAFTQAGCKNADNDPNADKGDDFKAGLDGWCSTKKAGSIFFWLVFAAWVASLVLTILDWRNGKNTRARDPPFNPPEDTQSLDEEESIFEQPMRKPTYEHSNSSQGPFSDNSRYSEVPSVGPAFSSEPPVLPRPSIDAYGAFSDPAPSGFAPSSSPPPDPKMSRTMQYADPYARVRTAVQGVPAAANPPSYSSYPSGY